MSSSSGNRSSGSGLRRSRAVRDRGRATSGSSSCTWPRSASTSARSTRTTATSRSKAWRPNVRSSRSPTAADRSSSCATARPGIVARPSRKAIAEAFDRLYADRPAAARMGEAGNALDPRRGAALARRRRAAARTDGVPRRRRTALDAARAVGGRRSARGPARSGSWCSAGRCLRRPPASPPTTGRCWTGSSRIGFNERHRMDVLWPIEPKDAIRFPGYHLGVFQLGNNVEFHLEIYRAAFLDQRADRAARPRARRLRAGAEDGRRSAGVHGGARGRPRSAANLTSPDVVRNEPLREPWAPHVARRARGIIVHSRVLQAIPGGGRVPHAGLRRAAPGRGVATAHASGPSRGRASCARQLEARGVAPRRGARRHERGEAARRRARGRCASFADERPRRDRGSADRGLRRGAASVEPRGSRDRVSVFADVDDDDFLGWLAAADVVVDLRFPHRGEVSGSLDPRDAGGQARRW